MNFIGNVINNFISILSSFGGSLFPSTTTYSAQNTISAGLDMIDDSSTLGLGVVTLGSAVSSAAFQSNELIEETKMNVSTQYVESLSDSELNELTSRLENIINEDKPKVLAKTHKPDERV